MVPTKHLEQSGFCCCHQTRGLGLGAWAPSSRSSPYTKLLSFTRGLKNRTQQRFPRSSMRGRAGGSEASPWWLLLNDVSLQTPHPPLGAMVCSSGPSVYTVLPPWRLLLLWVMARSDDPSKLTSNTMLSQGLEEVEGRSGPVRHGDELPVSVRVWRPYPSHLPIQGCLDVSTLPPDQRWNVPKKEGEGMSIFSTFIDWRSAKPWSKSLSTYLSFFLANSIH